MSHTYALMAVSRSTFDEVRRLLADAGYEHAFHPSRAGEAEGDVLDMHGLALTPVEPAETNNLIAHAEAELQRSGLADPDSDYDGMIAKAVLELVQVLSTQGHSGYSAKLTLEVFDLVARYKPLGPLTSDPAEWNEVTDPSNASGERTWQSRRQSSCFSTDGGTTYYDIDGDRSVIIGTVSASGRVNDVPAQTPAVER